MKSLSGIRLFVTPWIVACVRLLRPWYFQDKNTGVGCHFLLQGIFPAQGLNPGLLHWQVGSLAAVPFHCWERNRTVASASMDLASLALDPLRAMLDAECVLSTVSLGAQGLLAML